MDTLKNNFNCLQMREMHHDNINQFIGACLNPSCIHIVTEYCSKGSLQVCNTAKK